MKNIHVLPTDKPSRLYLGNNGNFVFRMMQTSIQSKNDDFTNQNIYITNDEEIKEGWSGYAFKEDVEGKVFKHFYTQNEWYKDAKKIILTDNQHLIKDGVQAIDDDFLEWFVKNSSCEEVEIISLEKRIGSYDGKGSVPLYVNIYGLVIPKEELKQLFTKGDKVLFTGQMIDENVVDKLVTVFYTMGRGELDDMSDIMDEYTHIYRVWNKDLKHIPKEEPKQETLEEIAERLNLLGRELYALKLGAKCQQEQDKNKYSEKEVILLLQKSITHQDDGETGSLVTAQGKIRTANFYSWFEKYKKK